MPGPEETLKRFTPSAAGLDRDQLLLAVGRASARPNRWWIAATAVLLIAESVTLGCVALLWVNRSQQQQPASPPPGIASPETDSPELPPGDSLPLPLARRYPWVESDLVETVIEDLPKEKAPLRAFGGKVEDIH